MIGGSFSKEIIDFFNQITFFYREIYLHNYIQKLTSTCIFFISPKFTHPLNRFTVHTHTSVYLYRSLNIYNSDTLFPPQSPSYNNPASKSQSQNP